MNSRNISLDELVVKEDGLLVLSVLDQIPEKRIYSTIGVYPDGEKKFNGVASQDLGSHIVYNINNRPGRALFLEGRCIYRGFLDSETISKLEKEFSETPHKPNSVSESYH